MLQHVERERAAPLGSRGEIHVAESDREYPDRREVDITANVPLPFPRARVVRGAVQFNGGHRRRIKHVESVPSSRDTHHVLSQETIEKATDKDALHGVHLEVTLATGGDARYYRKHSFALAERGEFPRGACNDLKLRGVSRHERAQRGSTLVVRHFGKGLAPRNCGFNRLPTTDTDSRRSVGQTPDANPPRTPAHSPLGGNDHLDSRRRYPERASQKQGGGTADPRLDSRPLRGGVDPRGRRLAMRSASVDSGCDSPCHAIGDGRF